MWYPRLASVGLLALSVAIYVLSAQHPIWLWNIPDAVRPYLGMLMFLGCIGFALSGLGGIIVSFGLELVGPGRYAARNTTFGRFTSFFLSKNGDFCSASMFCGLVIFLLIIFLLFSFIILSVAWWACTHLSEVHLPTIDFSHWNFSFDWASFSLATLRSIGAFILVGFVALTPVAAVIAAVVCIRWFLKKIPFYSNVCPVNISE